MSIVGFKSDHTYSCRDFQLITKNRTRKHNKLHIKEVQTNRVVIDF